MNSEAAAANVRADNFFEDREKLAQCTEIARGREGLPARPRNTRARHQPSCIRAAFLHREMYSAACRHQRNAPMRAGWTSQFPAGRVASAKPGSAIMCRGPSRKTTDSRRSPCMLRVRQPKGVRPEMRRPRKTSWRTQAGGGSSGAACYRLGCCGRMRPSSAGARRGAFQAAISALSCAPPFFEGVRGIEGCVLPSCGKKSQRAARLERSRGMFTAIR